MKNIRLLLPLFIVLLPGGAGCSRAETPPPSSSASPTESVNTPVAAPHLTWVEIQEITFDERERFLAGLERLQAQLEVQIATEQARRDALTGNRDPAKWDAALVLVGTARTRFMSNTADMAGATAQNWRQLQARAGEAWVKTQDALREASALAPL